MNRDSFVANLASDWDLIIIGGGASGLGCAVDGASRGLKTLLLEQADFAKGSSSRSTKLIHGGLRYLKQGNLSLVTEALHERGLLCKNAPHLVSHLPFLVPLYHWWEGPFYGIGLKIYDLLAGSLGLEPSKSLSCEETLLRIPTLEPKDLRGGAIYYDGQFDDARLAIVLAQTAVDEGATCLNYFPVIDLLKEKGRICGVVAKDLESNKTYSFKAKVVINATGVFSDTMRLIDDPAAESIIEPSQGIHIVVDRSFMPTDTAILIPQTEDGRVLFFIPWHHHVLIGTTDTPIDKVSLEPMAQEQEIEYLLKITARYLTRPIHRKEILSVFAGLRPLVRSGKTSNTAALSRDHLILVSPSNLLTLAGGKWTTYRKMAQDTIDKALSIAHLPHIPCCTDTLRLHAYEEGEHPVDAWLSYGKDRYLLKDLIEQDPQLGKPIHPRLPYCFAEVIWAARHEMARTLEDVLARRTRSLLLDVRAALEAAPAVVHLLAKELKRSSHWEQEQLTAFEKLSEHYF